jgi:hypothetical protein
MRFAGVRDIEMNRFVGLSIVVGGICLVAIGLLVYAGGFSWFGKLPATFVMKVVGRLCTFR